MAITSSAKKAYRASLKKRVFNLRRLHGMKDAIREVRKQTEAKNRKEAFTLLGKAYKAIDKARKGNTIKRNTADRMKSRLARVVNAVS